MSRDVITIHPEDEVFVAASLMLENKVAGLPVVDHDRLVGIITESDIFQMVVLSWNAKHHLGQSLRPIPSPISL